MSESDDNVASMLKFRREVTASPEAARQALKEAGIMTDDDEIASPYRELFGLSNQDPPDGAAITMFKWSSAMLKRLQDMTLEHARDLYERLLKDDK